MLNDIFDFLVDLFLWIPRQIFSWLVDAIISFFQLLDNPVSFDPIREFVNLSASFPTLAYLFNLFQFNYALSVVILAYLSRFLLRRIPFIN